MRVVKRDTIGEKRAYCSLCCYRLNTLVVTGAAPDLNLSDSTLVMTKCSRYDIRTDRWTALPNLNVGRYTHASCTYSGRWVYVLGGMNTMLERINSVEKLDMWSARTSWELITFDLPILPPQQNSKMV